MLHKKAPEFLMALNKEVWVTDIQETLELGLDFLPRMSDYSEFATNKTVHLPQSGVATQIYKNANVFPLAVAQRTDTLKSFDIDQYSTQAFLVTNIEEYQLSYNKRQSIMGQHVRALAENMASTVLQGITPTEAGRTVTTTGALDFDDIVKVAAILDKDNMGAADRTLELPVDMFYELYKDERVLHQNISGFSGSAVASGTFLEVAGIKIYKRPTVATISGAAAGVAYHKSAVAYAKDAPEVFTDSGDGNGNPLYGGGIIMSALGWLGVTRLRSDSKGVVALVRGA